MKLSQRNSELETDRSQSQCELGEHRAKCDELKRLNEQLLLSDTSKMAVNDHINALAALKQYVYAFIESDSLLSLQCQQLSHNMCDCSM